MNAVKINKEREKSNTFYTRLLAESFNHHERETRKVLDQMDNILDIRFYIHQNNKFCREKLIFSLILGNMMYPIM